VAITQKPFGYSVDLPQRVDHGGAHSGQPVGPRVARSRLQTSVDPADEVAVSDVANEQIQRIRSLIESTVAQP
jgi:hypothetical protein